MAKKCPPGVFCIQNVSVLGVLLLITLGVAVFMNVSTRLTHAKHAQIQSSPNSSFSTSSGVSSGTAPHLFSATMYPTMQHMSHHAVQVERPGDVLSDPRHPPLKDTSSLYGYGGGGGAYPAIPIHAMPINQPTQAPYTSRSAHSTYTQIGILTRKQGEKILPLMGRMSQIQRNKWQYYTMSDGNQSIRLPVSRNGRSCTNDNGCDEIMNGDTVYVEGYQDAFRATVYENDAPQYLPHVI